MKEGPSNRTGMGTVIKRLESEVLQYTRNSSSMILDDHDNLVRVYYLKTTTPKVSETDFNSFIRMVENCSSLCSIRATHQFRSKYKEKLYGIPIITPLDSTGTQVIRPSKLDTLCLL